MPHIHAKIAANITADTTATESQTNAINKLRKEGLTISIDEDGNLTIKGQKVTIVTKYDGHTADIFVAAISRPLSTITKEARDSIRRDFDCDGFGDTDEDDDDASNMFFQECEIVSQVDQIYNANGEEYSVADQAQEVE